MFFHPQPGRRARGPPLFAELVTLFVSLVTAYTLAVKVGGLQVAFSFHHSSFFSLTQVWQLALVLIVFVMIKAVVCQLYFALQPQWQLR